jgi:DNA polymerase I-like protein with 3'-5' exonuclease and polymerase domains
MFYLLEPVSSTPRPFFIYEEDRELDFVWEGFDGEVMALDFETNGLPPMGGGEIVGVGLSDNRGSLYIDVKKKPKLLDIILKGLVEKRIPLIAHNLFFEMQWTFGKWDLNWAACTYATYRHLANEGWEGQEYGLKKAQKDLLKWEKTNEEELDLWLIEHGFVANVSTKEKAGYYFLPSYKRWLSPKKGEMHRAPRHILGKYCCLDADATYQIWTLVFRPKLKNFPPLEIWMREVYVEYIKIHVEQRLRGILVDGEFLLEYRAELYQKVKDIDATLRFRFKEELLEWKEEKILSSLRKEEPEKFKDAPPKKEPKRFKKNGEATTAWLKWEHYENARKLGLLKKPTAKWKSWELKRQKAEEGDLFNFGSGPQRAWLFYQKLGYPIKIVTDKGAPGTGESALLGFGEDGKILLELIQTNKEISSIDSFLSLIEETGKLGILERARESGPEVWKVTQKAWEKFIYHPELRMPGTHTGRLSGSGRHNIQNPSKTRFMQCYTARPGYKIISFDIASLENVLLTEISKDSTLWSLYGPTAKQNDGYLFVGAQLNGLKEKILATGYDPYNPTKEGIKAAKEGAKKERSIAKQVTLAASYGAGASKIHQSLLLQGIDISLEECEAVHKNYWKLFSGVKKLEAEFHRLWKHNGGWFLNPIGRPICVAEDYLKDVNNRACQSGGHDVFILLLLEVMRLREEGLKFYPWIADVHDALYLEVIEEDAERLSQRILDRSVPAWNALLRGEIFFKGEPNIIQNLWCDKAEGADLEKALHFGLLQKERIKYARELATS